MKQFIVKSVIGVLIAICIYMIYIGAMGHSSIPRQEAFVQKLHEPLSTDPAYYLKGVTVPDHVTLDFSEVNTDIPGTYNVKVSQPGYTYQFQIIVE